jgi:hypothetical protein
MRALLQSNARIALKSIKTLLENDEGGAIRTMLLLFVGNACGARGAMEGLSRNDGNVGPRPLAGRPYNEDQNFTLAALPCDIGFLFSRFELLFTK